ncbi:hypothetical protein pclt_cds_517 [Pandoravirus celtis]|uniref:Uncharacterized protein n=1 Tax=Pandoravirus celtis TaxID=2568002 RepID=A0A4D6EH27_9VIRU|nr:hypothetical protein pclt_cds_517 [Pandoravirus celtis]
MQGPAADCAPGIDDINRMLDSLTNNLRACDRREEDAVRQRHHATQRAPHDRHARGGDVIIEADPALFACAPPPSLPDDPMVVFVDAPGVRPPVSSTRPAVSQRPPTAAVGEAPLIVCATDAGETIRGRAPGGYGTTVAMHANGAHSASASMGDDAEPWAAPGEWWDAGVRCVFEWLREAFAAALDRDARSALRRHGVTRFFAWPPVGGTEATAGGASAACSLTLMLRPWTPADRPAEAQRGRGGGPSGIEARRRDAENELAALAATAERVVARVEASGAGLAERHAALSEAVRGCAACLRTLLRLAQDESQVLRAHGAATREAAVIATRAVAIAQKWIYARTAERVDRAAERYGAMDAAVRYDFGRAEASVRSQRARFLVLWRDLKTRYDAFLAAAGLDGADPAAAQAMEALFWRGAGGEPPVDPGSGDDPAVAVAAAAADASADHGVDPDAFDGDALRLLRYYCEHMANVARSMLDRTTEEDSDPDEQANDNDAQQGAQIDDDEGDNDHHGGHMCDAPDVNKGGMPLGQRRRRRRESRGAVDDAVSSVSSEARRHIAACVAGGDDRARVLAEMRRARDRCRATARQIVARRRERARLLRPVRRRHVRRMRKAARDNADQQQRRLDNDNSNSWEPDPDEEDDDLLLLSSDDDDECGSGDGEGSRGGGGRRRRSADEDARARADQHQLEVAMAADAADARIEASARKRLADLEALMAGMAAQAVESGPHAEWMRATQRLGDALAEAQTAWRQAAEARAAREAILEEETARCLESVAATARAAHEADVGAVLCQWNERQHGIDRRRAEDLRQIAMARRVADEWLANFERKMVYYHEDAACAEAVGAVGEFRAVMGLHAGARGMVVRLAEFADAYEDLAYAWSLAYRVEYGDEMPPNS